MGRGSKGAQQHETGVDDITANLLPEAPHRLPTLSEIKAKLPLHCFRPTVSQSMKYVVLDIIYVTLTDITMYGIFKYFTFGWLLFPLYWYVQGTLYTSIFVLGHDCGHGSFSHYPLLNDIVGTILHTFILAPYYPWKVTHNQHHKNTANIDRDEVFYPQRGVKHTGSTFNDKVLFWAPGIGWFYYLLFGYSPRPINHFNPMQDIFYNKHLVGVLCSLGSYATMFYLMYLYASRFGFINLVAFHFVPIFIFACYMVIITLLQHTEVDVPWYSDAEWSNLKGQLSSIDRHYGPVHNVIHNIGTHQIHHLFTKVPHYHLEEATEHFRKAFPDLVKMNPEPILPSFAKMFHIFIEQRAIGKDTKIFQYGEERPKKLE